MGLLSSLFSRSRPADGVAPEADPGDSVAQARTRARQRLMGAVVLVGIGIVGFPLLFETQPRPIPVDVAIDIPRKEGAAPLAMPSARTTPAKTPIVPLPEPTRADAGGDKPAPAIITETAAEAGLSTASKPAVAVAKPVAKPDEPADVRATKDDTKAETKAEAKTAARPPADASDSARAQALLDGKGTASAPAAAPRFIVQIGAFADPALAQQTRLKVERLGLVTYTHVAQTADGPRTRVRVGPVTKREDADKMAAKLKAAGLPAAILTL